MKRLRLLLVLVFFVLAGCAGVPQVKPSIATKAMQEAHLLNIAAISQFAIKGRIAVQADGAGLSGGFGWQHGNVDDDITLYSPLGGQLASIKKTAEKVSLQDVNGNSIDAPDAQTLTQHTLGWPLPLSGLADWVLGRPSKSVVQASTLDDQGRLSTLKQEGWTIEYKLYSEQDGYFLPSKIFLRSEKVYLKLVVERWLHVDREDILK